MRKFKEKHLVQKLERILKTRFDTNLVFKEFSAGYGIADLVLAPKFSFNPNIKKNQPLTDFFALSIFLSLKEAITYSLDEIHILSPQLSREKLTSLLKKLSKTGYLTKTQDGLYIKKNPTNELNPIRKIIAIEAKISDYKNGLLQARRYKYFADESYLAILKEAEKNINFEELDNYNIGLILFDNNRNAISVRNPKPLSNIGVKSTINILAKEMMVSKFKNLSF